MKEAVFICGFNNWGKTEIIQHLFNGRNRFYHYWTYRIIGINSDFTVESHSNDDWVGENWRIKVEEKLNHAPAHGHNLFAALCPSMESNNNFVDLLNKPPFLTYDKLHIFLIEFKWEHHAKLIINNIINEGHKIKNANFIVINTDSNQTNDEARWNAKVGQIMKELRIIFP